MPKGPPTPKKLACFSLQAFEDKLSLYKAEYYLNRVLIIAPNS